MQKRTWLASVAMAAFVCLVAGPVVAQDQGGMDAEMAAMMAAAQPNEHHHGLEWAVGTWKASSKFYDAKTPGAPPMETVGEATNTMIMGGRFMTTEFSGDFMGMPFEGLGIEGYDNITKQHVSTWVDSMGTMILQSKGTCSDGDKVRTLQSDFIDPATGKPTSVKLVTTFESDNKHVFEMFTLLPDGEEFKVMQIVYSK